MRRALLGACAALLAARGAAAAPEISVDPRLELLGVVARLAGRPSAGPEDPDYARAVDARFGPFRAHPAVRLYAELGAGEDDPLGVVLQFYSDPPELRLKDAESRVPFLEDEAARQRVARFLQELRDFAARSDFAGFFRDNASRYRAAEEAARAELGSLDPEADAARYAGLDLGVRRRYALSLLYQPGLKNSFILPYPDPELLETARGPFETVTLFLFVRAKALRARAGVAAFSVPSGELWQETLFVLVEPALWTYERLRGGGRPEGAEKGALVAAWLSRLSGAPVPTATPDRARVLALAELLREYEKDRARWPTLWDYWPRLMSAFPGPAAPVPPKVARVADFFSPALRARLAERP